MFSRGYRPTGNTPHFAVVAFLRSTLLQQLGTLIGELDRMRKKRHISVYDIAGTISEGEVEHALKVSTLFHERAKNILASKGS